jgi:hypothetical protein
VAFVQKTLFAALEAIRTNPMRRFAALHICFYDVSNRPGGAFSEAAKFRIGRNSPSEPLAARAAA